MLLIVSSALRPTASPDRLLRKMRTRDTIAAGASRVLAERGLNAMTVEEVLEATGVARATFYAHFSDKHDVAREVIARMWRRSADRYERFATAPLADKGVIRHWLGQLSEDWIEHYKEVVALLRDLPVELNQTSEGYLDEFVTALVGDGRHWRCPPPEAQRGARLLIAQLQRAMWDLDRGAWRLDEGELLGMLATLWLQALGAP